MLRMQEEAKSKNQLDAKSQSQKAAKSPKSHLPQRNTSREEL